MTAALSSRIALLNTHTTSCSTPISSYIRSTLECAYIFGRTAGVLWGWLSDRDGRKVIAVSGLLGMSICCVLMGLIETFGKTIFLRFAAGVCSSAVIVPALTMLADISPSPEEKSRNVSKLPMVLVSGSVGPLLESIIRTSGGLSKRWPELSSHLTCASLIFSIFLAELVVLKETLPLLANLQSTEVYEHECEKGALLAELSHEDSSTLTITIVDQEDIGATPSSPLSLHHLCEAPSLMTLFVSSAILQMHTSIFDTVLPHLGHTPASHRDFEIHCGWLGMIAFFFKVTAAVLILRHFSLWTGRAGSLVVFRRISAYFPSIYLSLPLGVLLASTIAPTSGMTIVSLSVFAKYLLAESAQSALYVLLFSMAPNAESTGTTIGFMSGANLLNAAAVGFSGMSYFASDDYSTVIVNGGLWTGLTLIAMLGIAVNRQHRERPLVGADIPVDSLAWRNFFDAERDYR